MNSMPPSQHLYSMVVVGNPAFILLPILGLDSLLKATPQSCLLRGSKSCKSVLLGRVVTSLTGVDQAGTQTTIPKGLELELVPILGDIDTGRTVELTATPIQPSEVSLKFEIQIHDDRSRNQVSRPRRIAVSMPRRQLTMNQLPHVPQTVPISTHPPLPHAYSRSSSPSTNTSTNPNIR